MIERLPPRAGGSSLCSRSSSCSDKSSAVASVLCAPFTAMISSASLTCKANRVAVLALLDQEHHQEGDDGGTGVDDELPGVAEVEDRPAGRPTPGRRQDGDQEGQRLAAQMRAVRLRHLRKEPGRPTVAVFRRPADATSQTALGRTRRRAGFDSRAGRLLSRGFGHGVVPYRAMHRRVKWHRRVQFSGFPRALTALQRTGANGTTVRRQRAVVLRDAAHTPHYEP